MNTKRIKILSFLLAAGVVLAGLTAAGCKKEQQEVTVAIGATEITLDIFETSVLKATVVGSDEKPAWRSSDDSVVTVDGEGNLYPKSVGTAVVSTSVGEVSASCTVYVQDTGQLPVVRLNYTELDLASGGTIALSAEAVYKDKPIETAFTFDSLDEAVATVSEDGKVTAVAAGSTFIVVSAVINGATVYKQVSVTVLR